SGTTRSGRRTAPGTGSRTPCGGWCAGPRGGRRSRRPGWPTARRCGRPSSRVRAGTTGGKKTTGIKRHVCIDTIGLVWGLAVTPADVHDSKGARLAVADAKAASDRLVQVWADSAYQGFIEFALVLLSIAVAIVSRGKRTGGFRVQARRWVVERTFGWLTRWRRLNRNY